MNKNYVLTLLFVLSGAFVANAQNYGNSQSHPAATNAVNAQQVGGEAVQAQTNAIEMNTQRSESLKSNLSLSTANSKDLDREKGKLKAHKKRLENQFKLTESSHKLEVKTIEMKLKEISAQKAKIKADKKMLKAQQKQLKAQQKASRK